MWHVTSRSSVATLRTAIHLLLITYLHTLVVVISALPTDVGCVIHVRGHGVATVASLLKKREFGTATLLNVVIQKVHCRLHDLDPRLVFETRLVIQPTLLYC